MYKRQAYTYENFLKSVGKYPAICRSAATCPKILANMFAHFQQETAGLFYLEEINKGTATPPAERFLPTDCYLIPNL